eukprot:9821996-Alexandrium_andersonii.AAC.1
MAGKRLTELVAGQLDTVLHDVATHKAASMASALSNTLSVQQRQRILADFESGRGYISYLLGTKTDYLKKLPWLLAGLAHFDLAAAQRCCNAALAQWD